MTLPASSRQLLVVDGKDSPAYLDAGDAACLYDRLSLPKILRFVVFIDRFSQLPWLTAKTSFHEAS